MLKEGEISIMKNSLQKARGNIRVYQKENQGKRLPSCGEGNL